MEAASGGDRRDRGLRRALHRSRRLRERRGRHVRGGLSRRRRLRMRELLAAERDGRAGDRTSIDGRRRCGRGLTRPLTAPDNQVGPHSERSGMRAPGPDWRTARAQSSLEARPVSSAVHGLARIRRDLPARKARARDEGRARGPQLVVPNLVHSKSTMSSTTARNQSQKESKRSRSSVPSLAKSWTITISS